MKYIIVPYLMLDIENNLTTKNVFVDGILNGLFVALIFALISFFIGQSILYRLKFFISLFFKFAFMVLSYVFPAIIILLIFPMIYLLFFINFIQF
uniref:Uncharacterized protein n=2 Tax=Meloidogyne enterolobii TaxID=390850 RepID=A0A6V7WFL9_MELEN|nr:unnamed protein product [Meloidogyne enterolobii]